MLTTFYSLFFSKIFLFYLSMLISVLVIKKLCHVKILINAIWFSEDGSVPKHAVDNLVQLANDIKKSGFRKNYQILFWTDKLKLSPDVKKIFIKQGIKIKDYQKVHPKDETSRTALQWVQELLLLGNSNNKLYYVLASDIFRLYLLCKELPYHYSASYALYMDCNDIFINKIPHPYLFRKLQKIAFHFVNFSYQSHDIFAKLLLVEKNESMCLLTNDVIVTLNKKTNTFLSELFECFCANLKNISANGLIDFLKVTSRAIHILDDELVFAILFSTTHMVNSLYLTNTEEFSVCILNYISDKLELNCASQIQDVEWFVDFTRNYSHGLTCLQRKTNLKIPKYESNTAEMLREQWYQLFITRYQLRACIEQFNVK